MPRGKSRIAGSPNSTGNGPHIRSKLFLKSAESNSVTKILSFDNITRFIAIAIPCAFIFSCLYDYEYFSVVGASFYTVPTTISDHTRTALLWAPFSFSSVLFIIYLRWYHIPLLKIIDTGSCFNLNEFWGRLEYKIYNIIRKYIGYYMSILWVIIRACSVVAISMYFLFGEYFFAFLVVALIVIVPDFVPLVLRMIDPRLVNTPTRRNISWLVALLVLIPLLFGKVVAIKDLKHPPFAIQTINSVSIDSANLIALRNFEKGILCYNKETSSSYFLPWEYVQDINMGTFRQPNHGYLCNWLGRCSTENIIDKYNGILGKTPLETQKEKIQK